jgi:hypothetical protein
VAIFCGTSVAMIERHYWRWIEADGREGVRLESTLLGAAIRRRTAR